MRIIAFRALREFWKRPECADSEISLRAWYQDVKNAEWNSPNELKQQYRNASILGEGRVVLNIRGNACRLVVAIDYEYQAVYVRFIGTHREFERINAKTIQTWK